MKKAKILFALALVAALSASLLCVSAFAAESDGSGGYVYMYSFTFDHPYTGSRYGDIQVQAGTVVTFTEDGYIQDEDGYSLAEGPGRFTIGAPGTVYTFTDAYYMGAYYVTSVGPAVGPYESGTTDPGTTTPPEDTSKPSGTTPGTTTDPGSAGEVDGDKLGTCFVLDRSYTRTSYYTAEATVGTVVTITSDSGGIFTMNWEKLVSGPGNFTVGAPGTQYYFDDPDDMMTYTVTSVDTAGGSNDSGTTTPGTTDPGTTTPGTTTDPGSAGGPAAMDT